MGRAGQNIQQLKGYKAFIPIPLPPEPSLPLKSIDFIKKIKIDCRKASQRHTPFKSLTNFVAIQS